MQTFQALPVGLNHRRMGRTDGSRYQLGTTVARLIYFQLDPTKEGKKLEIVFQRIATEEKIEK